MNVSKGFTLAAVVLFAVAGGLALSGPVTYIQPLALFGAMSYAIGRLTS